jgi:peptide/nickel transport system substrate-binding protein
VLTRNPDWKATTPAFEEIEIIIVADVKAGELALQAGELEIADLQPETAANFDKSPLPGISLVTLPGAYYQWIGMNVEHPKLADVRVRKAIQRAIDMASVVEGAYANTSIVAGGIVPPGILGYRKEARYAYAPDEAKALLAEAGIRDLSLDLHYDVTNNFDAVVAQIVQANLSDVGITVNLKPTDSGVYWNLGLESKGSDWKDLQLVLQAFRTGPDPADALQWFHSEQVGIWNWQRWKSEEWDKLWTEALAEKATEKRGAMYLRMQDLMEDSGAFVWVTYWPRLYGVSERIKPAFYPGGDYRLERFVPA